LLAKILRAFKIACVQGAQQELEATLGDVLYADRSRPLISETEWLRLVRAVAAGDQVALHALYERAHRIVFTLILRITQGRETAEEVTLDVFHDVWRRAATYDPANGTVLGWILNQARSRAIDRLRFDSRKRRVAPQLADSESTPVPVDTPDVLEFRQQARALRAALGVLTPDERAAIEAVYLSGLTGAEAAVSLKAPLGTVKTRIRAGLAKLRRALNTWEAGR